MPFDIQGDTHVLEFELTGTLDSSTFRGTGIRDRGGLGSNNGNRGTDAGIGIGDDESQGSR
jgi:hypothetical protein